MRIHGMQYLVMAILAVVLFATGFLVADLRTSEVDAQGTWQIEIFEPDPVDLGANQRDAEELVESLPSDCDVDFEAVTDLIIAVAYSCPE